METNKPRHIPEILAPAGTRDAFLAALAAGADAVYCGLKQFSARMEAKNFKPEELAPLVGLAHEQGAKVFVTFNTLIKPGELDSAYRFIAMLGRQVKPDGIIVQDLGAVRLIRHAGFSGEVHLSTLANATFPAALDVLRRSVGADRVVIPRELNIDEIRTMAGACPAGLSLEVFVHGALCYGVSGRCYWSSFMGGKSGLRGRCVQPCRRLYRQKQDAGRYFSCQDLGLDVLAKVLKGIPQIAAWKIEGRKKGPHYVYYTVRAYRLLRDRGMEPEMKRTAVQLLERALGRTGTHYHFLPQRPQNPVDTARQTGSGFLMGTVKGPKSHRFFIPKEELLSGDLLRVGYEDDPYHALYRIRKQVPKKGKFYLHSSAVKVPEKGAPVFLTDRREKALADLIRALEAKLPDTPAPIPPDAEPLRPKHRPKPFRKSPVRDMVVHRRLAGRNFKPDTAVWISSETVGGLPGRSIRKLWWWLPPVIWPENEEELAGILKRARKQGARRFVVNAPWQTALFPEKHGLRLWAGPFCNFSNAMAFQTAAAMGFNGAIVSPELGRSDFLALPADSPIPLGMVIAGHWPFCISRVLSDKIQIGEPFASPRNEQAWVARHGPDFWVFPNWALDLKKKRDVLMKAGYRMFVRLDEPVPKAVKLKQRSAVWNWDGGLA